MVNTMTAVGNHMGGAPTRGGTNQKTGVKGQAAGPVNFVRASVEHREPFYDASLLMTTSVQGLPDIVIPAYGFIRYVTLYVTVATLAGQTAAVATAGNPFNILQNIIFQEPNGAQICNFPSGYDCYVANKFGGYWFHNDPRQNANFSVTLGTSVGLGFTMRIPVELSLRDALGALPNQNSGAQFRIKLNLNNIASVFGGTIAAAPTCRVRAIAEEWDQPEDMTDGQANQTQPPALNTTQYWTRQDYPVNAGQQNIRLTRVGNLVRNLVLVLTDVSGVRSTMDANWPDPLTIYYDTRPLDTIPRYAWLQTITDRYGYIAQVGNTNSAAGTVIPVDSGGGRESSVWPYDFCHEFSGQVGRELRDLWLPTLSSTRLEVSGIWGAAGTLSVLTNDVTIADNVWL